MFTCDNCHFELYDVGIGVHLSRSYGLCEVCCSKGPCSDCRCIPKSITEQQTIEYLKGVSYKNNEFKCIATHKTTGRPIVTMIARVPDRDTGELRSVGFAKAIPSYVTEKNFYSWLLKEAIGEWEAHESAEFFKINGEIIFDPHRDERKKVEYRIS